MPGSLFRKLHRRYGPKLSGAERFARARQKQEAFGRWFSAAAAPADCANAAPRGVAVIGGGFAGLAAAYTLGRAGMNVTVFEARAVTGGRVETDRQLVPGRLIEAGAELIGLNHPMWLSLAKEFGLGLTVLTTEEMYAGAGLEMPLRIKGKAVPDRKKLYEQMKVVFRRISEDAKAVKDPFAPWKAAGAAALDAKSVASNVAEHVRAVPAPRHPLLVDAIEIQLGNDNVLPTKEQSYLGLLALVAGGRFGDDDVQLAGYWETTEDFRCSEGNDRLGVMLHEYGRFQVRTRTPVHKIEINEAQSVVKVTFLDLSTGKVSARDFDYAVLAVPPNVWWRINISPPFPPGMEMATGPAVKYLARVPGRFWIAKGLAPSGLADDLGQTWEGTENQTQASQGIELSVYAGGVTVPKTDGAKHFRTRLPTLYPGFTATTERYADWPSVPFIEAGNVCPKVGQVTTIGKFLSEPHKKRLFFAGEQAAMAFLGYMEGALQSGARAADAILRQCVRGKTTDRAPRRNYASQGAASAAVSVSEAADASSYRIHQAVTATRNPMDLSRLRSIDWPESPTDFWEQTQPAPPKGLVLLSHSHVQRTCPDCKAFQSEAAVTEMTPASMEPGFLTNDTIQFDTTLDGKLLRLILDTPKYAAMLSAESRKTETAHKEDKLRVAVVDITGTKICMPGFAGWGSTTAMPGGSSAKVCLVYAAHQLLFDLNEMARTGSITTRAALEAKAATTWSLVKCRPDLKWLVDVDQSGPIVRVAASAKLRTHLEEMVNASSPAAGSSTSRASELVMRLGFEYVGSVLFQSGLRHPTRGGLWFGNTFKNISITAKPNPACHGGKDPIVWTKNPLGNTGISITALSVASFFTLLAQRRLVNQAHSVEMERLLRTGCGFMTTEGVAVRATKCGLTSQVKHDAALLQGSKHTYALAVLTTNPAWAARNDFINDLDQLVRGNNP